MNCSWLVFIEDASHLELALVSSNKLAVCRTPFKSLGLFCLYLNLITVLNLQRFYFSDRFVGIDSGVNDRLAVFALFHLRSEDWNAVEGVVLDFKFPNRQARFAVKRSSSWLVDWLLWEQLPQKNARVPSQSCEASIVFQPRDRLNGTIVAFKCKVSRRLTGVKLVNDNGRRVGTSEVLASMGELNLIAELDVDAFEGFQFVRQNVHHSDLFSERNHNMEAGWMQCYSQRFFWEALAQVEIEIIRWVVRPNSNCSVVRASCKHRLLDADVKTHDTFAVKARDQVLILSVFIGPLQIDLNF